MLKFFRSNIQKEANKSKKSILFCISAQEKCIFLFSFSAFGFVMYAHWESEICAYLATKKITLPFNTMQDLLTNTDMKVMVLLESFHSDSFEFSNDPVRSKIWHERIKPNVETYYEYVANDNEINDALKDLMLDDESYTVFGNYHRFNTYKEYKDCKIVRANGLYNQMYRAFGLQKNSTYLFVFNYFLQLLKEGGPLERLVTKDLTYELGSDKQFCPGFDGKPLDMSTCFTAFIVLFTGATISVIFFVTECVAKILKIRIPKHDLIYPPFVQ